MDHHQLYPGVGIAPNEVDSPYRCVLCQNPTHVDSRRRALAHRFVYRGPRGSIIYDHPCAGRGMRTTRESGK